MIYDIQIIKRWEDATDSPSHANLAQSPAIKPLMQKLISFAAIAMRTGNHKITEIICSSARKRDHMIYMVGIFTLSKGLLTIVATSFLDFDLLLYILYGVTTAIIPLQCFSFIDFCLIHWPILMPMYSLSYSDFFNILTAISSLIFNVPFSVSPISCFLSSTFPLSIFPLIPFIVLLVIMTILPFACSFPFKICLSLLFALFVYTLFASRPQSKYTQLVGIEAIKSSWLVLSTSCTLFHAFRNKLLRMLIAIFGLPALFAIRLQPQFPAFICMKILSCCRKRFFTPTTNLNALINVILSSLFRSVCGVITFSAKGRNMIFTCFSRIKVFRGGGENLLTLGASFLRDCLTSGYGSAFNRLVAECVKIECALIEVFWYTIHTEEINPFFRHVPRCFQYRWSQHRYGIVGTNHIKLPHHYSINQPVEQLYGLFDMGENTRHWRSA